MKKTVFAKGCLIALSIVALAACGETNGGTSQVTPNGHHFNVWCWNNEFQGRFRAYSTMWDHTDADGNEVLKDGTTLRWVIHANDNNGYQTPLDAALAKQETTAADDKIDMFLAEADYIRKYTDGPYALPVSDFGITESDLAQQYAYTHDIAKDSDGVLKGVSWQATPGLFAYRRSMAKEVLGTDDPTTVQTKLSDWDKFNGVAAQMKEAKHTMLAGFADAYRTYSNNVSAPWVSDEGVVSLDPNIKKWIVDTKNYVDNGYSKGDSDHALWKDGWAAEQGPNGNTFGFFYSTWGINFTLLGYSDPNGLKEAKAGESIYGDWAVCEGPQSYYWGGTWMLGAKGTDDKSLIEQTMLDLTCNRSIMKDITIDTEDYTNNSVAMNEIANDKDYGSAFLGGQNHIALFAKNAAKIDMKNMTAYDQGCNESLQNAFQAYFTGDSNWATCYSAFKTKIGALYSKLTFDDASFAE